MKCYISGGQLRDNSTPTADAWVFARPVLEIEEDDLKRIEPPESADEELQRVERVMLNATARWLQLTGRAEPPLPRSERERLRDVIEAMRPIVDAARDAERIAKLTVASALDAADVVWKAVVNHRDALHAALSNWPDSQTLSEAERMWPVVQAAMDYVDEKPNANGLRMGLNVLAAEIDHYRSVNGRQALTLSPGTLTPAEWSALFELRRAIDKLYANSFLNPVDNPDNRKLVVSAIDKLRETAYANSYAAREERRR